MKLSRLAAAVLGATVLPVSTVNAALVLTATSASLTSTDIGASFTTTYNGIGDDPVTPISGLTASSTYTLASVAGGGSAYTFSYSIDNTSSGPVSASRISIFGFNVAPNISSASATGLFGAGVGSGNVPNGQPNVEVCFKAGGGGGNCTGGGGSGVDIPTVPATGTFTLNFGSVQNAITLDNFYIRYQSLTSSQSNATSASGTGTVVQPVPEPATWAMMISGFGLIGSTIRRRRSATAFA